MEIHTDSAPWPVIGHDWATDLLRRAVAAGRPPHALLISGPPNVGKDTLARALAQTLLCRSDRRPCGVCRACRLVDSGNHPDVRRVEPQNHSLKIDQVRALTRQLSLSPLEGSWQIAILDRFELATAGAANALLKTLEEPPPTAVLVLLAQQSEALLPTIVSRCQIIALRPIPRSVVETALIERWHATGENARLLSHICGGRLGWAVTAATDPKSLKHRTQCLDDHIKLLHSKQVVRFAYVEELARQGLETTLGRMELWTSWWRDMLLLTSGCSISLTNIDRQAELAQLAAQCNTTAVHNVLSALQTTMEQLGRNANIRLSLEVLFLRLPSFS